MPSRRDFLKSLAAITAGVGIHLETSQAEEVEEPTDIPDVENVNEEPLSHGFSYFYGWDDSRPYFRYDDDNDRLPIG